MSLTQDRVRAFNEAKVDIQRFAGAPPRERSATFEIEESDPRWDDVRPLLAEFKALDITWTRYSEEELASAECVAPTACWERGYPQPESSYEQVTYDLLNYCKLCGSGLVQNRPFRMKGEPPWGKRSIMRLIWVPDEYFVPPEIWQTVFKPLGVGFRPVLNSSGQKQLESVVQLDVPQRVPLRMPLDVPFEVCPGCGVKKYEFISRGNFPPPETRPREHMFKSEQYFGKDTAQAIRHVMVDHELYAAIAEHKVKGAEFNVCGPPLPWRS